MPFIIFALYIASCVVCGIMGRHTTFGFMGHFLMALFLTPLLDFVIQAVGRPSTHERDKRLASRSR